MTKLSVNINKIATLRNARGGDEPSVLQAAIHCQLFGAEGITVHPRPDERHIRYQDVRDMRSHISTEFNIEGYPNEKFLALCQEVKPDQVTLVPDGPDVLTSNAGWDCITKAKELKEIIGSLQAGGMRVSLFLDPDVEQVNAAVNTGTDRIELYTEAYAAQYAKDKFKAIDPYMQAAEKAYEQGLGLNAGHDLNQENLKFFAESIPNLLEVSIGHALISEALYEGLEVTIGKYLEALAGF